LLLETRRAKPRALGHLAIDPTLFPAFPPSTLRQITKDLDQQIDIALACDKVLSRSELYGQPCCGLGLDVGPAASSLSGLAMAAKETSSSGASFAALGQRGETGDRTGVIRCSLGLL
jgi:hypothetical protein